MHSWSAPLSIIVGIVLVALAPTWQSRLLLGIFAASITLMFTVSATFHRLQWTDAGWVQMRKLDMTAIYLLIAGEYTGVAGVALEDPWRSRLLVVVWCGTAIGIIIRWLPIKSPFGLTTAIYIAIGSTLLLAIREIYDALGLFGFATLLAGCGFYLIGGLMLGARWPNPRPGIFGYHEVWHTFVTAAVVLHYICVFTAVLPKA